MGRGRAKAKQTKVARELKYRNLDTDFSELQRELHGGEAVPEISGEADTDDEESEPYARYDDSESTAS